MNAFFYGLGIVLWLIFTINLMNMFFISFEKLTGGKADSNDTGFVFSSFLGVIGYLLIQLYK